MEKPSFKLVFFLLLFVGHLATLWTPLTHPPLMVDKEAIIDPLTTIDSFYPDYKNLLLSGKIYDFQPLRDLSLYLDLKIDDLLNWSHTGTITNLIIFYLTLILLFKIFLHFFDKKSAIFLASIFLTHPLYFFCYIEITQRKHILSFLLILATYYILLKGKSEKKYLLSYFFYFLSILSHPINALIPAWFFSQEKKPFSKKTFLSYVPFATLFLLIYFTNDYLYRNIHSTREGVNYSNLEFIPEQIIYSIGLHFRQFFFPISFSNFYSLGNISVLIFSFAPITYVLYVYKRHKKNMIFLVLPLIIIFFTLYGHKSNVLTIFLQNPYVLTPSFIFLLFIGFAIRETRFNSLLWITPLLLLALTLPYSLNRKDAISLYEHTYPKEPECRSLQVLVVNYIGKGKIEKLKKSGHEWLNQKCFLRSKSTNFIRPFINTHLILENEKFSYEEKKYLLLNKYETPNDLVPLELVLKLKYGKELDSVPALYKRLYSLNFSSFFVSSSYIGKIIKGKCKDFGNESCAAIADYFERSKNLKAINEYKMNFPSLDQRGEDKQSID
ncbi:MAG: hypothetical protein CME65_09480 [Halobacteriovoraceae bacterium]|nr:hypothetical protein [Halobacteriovoraceae bacterium]|tara:strand:+ start:1172 stop:2830 length:1659 start_codon:yes stop_codon:yes gene_type:complete